MKALLNLSKALFFAALAAAPALAQQQPVVSVAIESVAVSSDVGGVIGYTVLDGGRGYTSAPTVNIIGGGGTGAKATAQVAQVVDTISVGSGGAGYTSAPSVTIVGSVGAGATAVAVVENGEVIRIDVTTGGSGYTAAPTVTLSGGGGSGATAAATVASKVVSISVDTPGDNYSSEPLVTLTGGGGTGATAMAAVGALFEPPNESYGPAGKTIYVTARGTGTWLKDSFTYSFFVNGVSIGVTSSPVPPPQTCTVWWTPPQPGSYFITVKITDGANSATSLPIRYFATGTVVNSPMDNTIVPRGSSVVLKADATVRRGFIDKMQFFDNGVPIGGPDSTLPYSLIYTPPGDSGSPHLITAQATDNDGNLLPVSKPISLQIVNAILPGPTSVISSPANGAAVPVPASADSDVVVAVDATAGSSGKISKVELYIDGVLFETKVSYPYTFKWHPSVIGSYNLVALTYDDKNNVVASSTSTGATATPAPTVVRVASVPTVTLIKPMSGGSTSDEVSTILEADATDSNVGGSITSVKFLQDGAVVAEADAPKSGTNTFVGSAKLKAKVNSNGDPEPSLIQARAVNAMGLTATSPGVSVTIIKGGAGGGAAPTGQVPIVAVTAPANGGQQAVNQPVMLTADASDIDGNVVSVQFFVNGQSVATSTYPYRGTWTPTALGRYSIVAKATDNDNNVVASVANVVAVIDPRAGDMVASGFYMAGTSLGSFSAVNSSGTTATFIGYIPASQTTSPAKTYYFTNMAVDGGGAFTGSDESGQVTISGTFTGAGVMGTIVDNGTTIAFSGPNTSPLSNNPVPAGYYAGSINGKSGSVVTGLVGLDGKVTFYLKDGSFSDSGAGTITSTGAFSFTTRAGHKLAGTVNPRSGFLAGTLTPSGSTTAQTFNAALATGGISDGSLRNISTLGQVSGNGVMIAGFVINGSTPKRILLRAVGPSLSKQGVPDPLAHPQLSLYRAGATRPSATNDEWGLGGTSLSDAAAQVGAQPLGSGTMDAAMIATLNPGIYTAQVTSVGNTTGKALVEMYDLDAVPSFSPQKMVNISTLGQVGTGDNILIAGFVVGGTASKTVLIRGLGPVLTSLNVPNALPDPMLRVLKLVNQGWGFVRENDNWDVGNDAAVVRTLTAKVGAQPPLAAGSKDAVLLIALPPGVYSAQLSGVNGATGTGMVEVYEVQ